MSTGPETLPTADEAKPALSKRLRTFVDAVRSGDESMVEDIVLELSRRHRIFKPLAFAVGGLAMLFTGLKLLFSNWRLTLVQALPAMWIWAAMFDLKAHALHGKTFHVVKGPILIPPTLAVVAVTAASFYLNAIFAFAIVQPGTPEIRPAVERAKHHLKTILWSGGVVGLMLAFSTLIVTRWGRPWFGISLSIVIAVLMVCYVAVPSRLIGVKAKPSRRDKLAATAVGGAVGAVVCAPPYILGRLGILMLGSSLLFIPGIVVISVAALLQAGATGAVKTVKMSAKLVPSAHAEQDPVTPPPPT
jgi:uncharacterized membrane protein